MYFKGDSIENAQFYQYAFKAGEMKNHLEKAGFEIVESVSTSNFEMGFEDELPFLKRIYRLQFFGRIIRHIIKTSKILRRLFSHTRIYVCKKP